jgi:hypothetical protein
MDRLTPSAVGAACGLIAGLTYIGIMVGTPGALILVYLTQLPLFAAGLWFGVGAAAIAGATGTLVLLAAGDLAGAGLFAVLNAGPVTLLVRQALLSRPNPDGTVVWYPPGLLAAWLTGLALGGIAIAVVAGGGPETLQATLREVIGTVLDRVFEDPVPNRDEVAETLAMIVPGVIAASWMITMVLNGALAQGVLARFGVAWRESPDLARLGLPIWVPLALGAAAGATFFEGGLRFIGTNMLIALSVSFCLAGLAVLHAAVRRLSQPAIALVSFYTMAVLFGWPFLAIAVVGLLESWLGLRHRLAPQGVNNDG